MMVLSSTSQQEVSPPVGRVEAPVTGTILQTAVGVAYKVARTEEQTAVGAFDAGGVSRRVKFRLAQTLAFAETFVVDSEPTGRRGRRLRRLVTWSSAGARWNRRRMRRW